MSVERTEWDLVRLAGSGDKEAFRELVERYQRRVLAVVMGMLHDREAALEVTQETFIKAFRSIGRFKGDASFYTWIYRIAVNLAIDHQRREWRRPLAESTRNNNNSESPPEDILERIRDQDPRGDPFEATKDAELRERVRKAIDELTPDHKAVILLRELEGLSYEEISRVMQCSKGTVMSRLHYARKKLQARLKEFV
ncbi:MAG: sigma-70 family RNA polymerase sigma factor [Thermodesulfobacteriota bacterium]